MNPAYAIPMGTAALGALAGIAASPLWIPPWINGIADKKRFLAKPREGYAFEIGNGPVHSFVMNKKGYAFRCERREEDREDWGEKNGGRTIEHEADKWWIEPLKPGETISNFASALGSIPIIGRSMGGIHWIGVPPSKPIPIHQRWVSKLVSTELGKERDAYKSEDKTQEDINVQKDNYVLFLNAAEDRNLIPYNVVIIINTEITNPYLAFVKNNKWLEIVEERLLPEARVMISENDFDGIVSKDFTNRLEAHMMERVASGLREKMEEELGIKIYHVQIAQIQPPNEILAIYEQKQATIQKAKADADAALELERKYVNEGNALIARAGKNVEVKKLEAKAEVEYAGTVADMLKDKGDEGRQALLLEQLQKGVPGATFVAPGINAIVNMMDPKIRAEEAAKGPKS